MLEVHSSRVLPTSQVVYQPINGIETCGLLPKYNKQGSLWITAWATMNAVLEEQQLFARDQ